MSQACHRFRLFPEAKSGLYIVARVWPTRAAMIAHIRRGGLLQDDLDRVHACCGEWKTHVLRGERWRIRPQVAEVNFYRQRLGIETVTHELFHATIAWGRRIKFDFTRLGAPDSVNDDEERLTYAHGRLCRAFMSRALHAGLYAEE